MSDTSYPWDRQAALASAQAARLAIEKAATAEEAARTNAWAWPKMHNHAPPTRLTYDVIAGQGPTLDPALAARLDQIEEKIDRLLDEQARRAILEDYRRLTGREP